MVHQPPMYHDMQWATYEWVGTHWRFEADHPREYGRTALFDIRPPLSPDWIGTNRSIFKVTVDPELGPPRRRTLEYNSLKPGDRVRPLGLTLGDNMAQKEFTMQVRVVSDDKNVFSSAKEIMKQLCRDGYAQLAILGGSSENKPDIKLFSDDFIEGKEELVDTKGGTADLASDEDPEDKVL